VTLLHAKQEPAQLRPARAKQEPAHPEQEPAPTEQKPAHPEQKPAHPEQKPAHPEQKPAHPEQEPAHPEQEPAAGGPPTPPVAGPADTVAAGVICWRSGRDGGAIEVLMVHRPAYDDWSWPKGEPERREGLPECAVREAARETGAQVVLGRPLPPVRYAPAEGSIKEVAYWAARVTGRPADGRRTRGNGVDDVRWIGLDKAARRLTHAADTVPLEALAGYAEAGTLATSATLVIRHATARPRDAWARADADRPLVASGKRQAMALGALLQCWRPEVVLCSPWRRCLESMNPYLAASGARLRTKGGLSEAGHQRSPAKAGRHIRSLLGSAHGGALCTHRPVLGIVLDAVRAWCPPDVACLVPDSNPYLHPGDVLVAHVAHRHGQHPLVVAVERHGTR
jgi:8-oxo-dGTP diphosphatase